MKKVISTILSLVMLATPLVSSTCFADKSANGVGTYVQKQDRSEQGKFGKATAIKVGKIAGCVTAGTVAIVGTAVAGLKIFEDALPDSLKKLIPSCLRKLSVDSTSTSERMLPETDEGKAVGAILTAIAFVLIGATL